MADKVAIIIPCYNQAQYLPMSIESALGQRYDNIEVIVVDDGSTDNSYEVALSYFEKVQANLKNGASSPTMKIVRQDNMGLPIARNAGIHASRTVDHEYIIPLDADDWLDQQYAMKTTAAMTPEIGVVGTVTACFGIKDYCWDVPPVAHLEKLMIDNCVPVCSLIRRRCLVATGGYNRELKYGYEDWNLWIDIAKRGWKIINLREGLFHYREKPESMLKEATKRRPELVAKIHSLHPELWPVGGQHLMANKWVGHRTETSGGEFYGVEQTYSKAADFIKDGPVEDWGCGTCYARKFFTNGYVGVDGTPDYCDKTAELARYKTNVHGILMRHVIEHNFDWEIILKNAIASCKKLALVICTPFEDATHLIRIDEFGIPIFAFRKEDVTKHFTAGYTEEVISGAAWGTNLTETIFYVNGLGG